MREPDLVFQVPETSAIYIYAVHPQWCENPELNKIPYPLEHVASLVVF